MATQQYGGSDHSPDSLEDGSKPSLFKKVKAKAQKLKSKVKPGSTGTGDSQASPDVDTYETDSDDGGSPYDDVPYTPLSNAINPPGTAGSNPSESVIPQQSSYNSGIPSTNAPSPRETPAYKSSAPTRTEQAVPTNYSYYNADPSQARLPSSNSPTQRPQNAPVITGVSPGLEPVADRFKLGTQNPFSPHNDPGLTKSGERNSVIPRDVSESPTFDEDHGLNYAQPTRGLSPEGLEQDSDVSYPRTPSHGPLTPHNSVQAGGFDFPASHHNTTPAIDEDNVEYPQQDTRGPIDHARDALGGPNQRTPESADYGNPVESADYGNPTESADYGNPASKSVGNGASKPIHHRAYEGIAATAAGAGAVAAGVGNKFATYNNSRKAPPASAYDNSPNRSDKPVTEKASDTAAGLRDTAADKLGYADQSLSPDDTPVSQKAADKLGYADQALSTDGTPVSQKAANTTNSARDYVASTIAPPPKPMTDRATDSAYGLKDAAANKLGYGNQTTPDNTPLSQKAANAVNDARGYAASTIAPNKSPTDRATDSAYGLKDAAANKLGYGDQTTTDNTPVSQKAANTATNARDYAASGVTPNDGQQKPLTDRAADAAYGWKDAAANKLGYGDQTTTDNTPVSQKAANTTTNARDYAASAVTPNDGQQKPLTDRAADTAYGLKDAAANKLGYGDQTPTDDTPVAQKAANTATNARDYAASGLTPNDGQQKPLTDRAADAAYGLKDAAASKLPGTGGNGRPADTAAQAKDNMASRLAPNDGQKRPVTERLSTAAMGAKTYAADKLNYADNSLSSDDRPVSHKAREVARQKTTPDHHDKALAGSVTETLNNLPGLLSSKLGLGGSPASSPRASDVPSSTPSSTPSSGTTDSAAPGMFNRVSGMASSLFAKKPEE